MFTRALLCIAAAFATIVPARSEVLIYTGTTRRTEPKLSLKARVLRCYVVTEPQTNSVAVIGYGKQDGMKRRDLGEKITADYYPLAQLSGAVFDLYAYTFVDKSIGVQQSALFLRGPQKTVTVDRNFANPVFAQRAKVLKGVRRIFGAGLGYGYVENDIVVTLNQTRTIDANVRDLTFDQARTEITQLLSSLGYSL